MEDWGPSFKKRRKRKGKEDKTGVLRKKSKERSRPPKIGGEFRRWSVPYVWSTPSREKKPAVGVTPGCIVKL